MIDYKLKSFANALERLDEALSASDDAEFKIDASVKRFEFTYEIAKKTLLSVLVELGVRETHPRALLQEASQEELDMIKFYTEYWNQNATTLLKGDFIPHKPLANYPICEAISKHKHIYGVYDNYMIPLKTNASEIDIINGQLESAVVLDNANDIGQYDIVTYDCKGDIIEETSLCLSKGMIKIDVPPSGLIKLSKTL